MSDKSVGFILDYPAKSWSGVDDYYLELCKQLKARHFRSLMIYSERPPEHTQFRFESAGAISLVLPYKHNLSYFRTLRANLQRYRVGLADVCFFDYFSGVPWLTRLAGVRRIVYTEANSGKVNADSWKLSLLRLRTRLMTRPMTRVIAMSNYIRERSVHIGIEPQKVSVIYQGVDMSRYLPDPQARGTVAKKYGLPEDDLLIVCVNRLVPFKHCDIAIEAVSVLNEHKVPAQLLVAGEGPLRPKLQELARERKIAHRVHFLGYYPQPESLLQGCDIFILPSVGEAFGYVLAEAMACGLPVVGSNSGSIPELVEHGETGLLAAPLDHQSFAQALENLANNPKLRVEMGRRATQRAREKFDLKLTVDRTLQLYEELWEELRV